MTEATLEESSKLASSLFFIFLYTYTADAVTATTKINIINSIYIYRFCGYKIQIENNIKNNLLYGPNNFVYFVCVIICLLRLARGARILHSQMIRLFFFSHFYFIYDDYLYFYSFNYSTCNFFVTVQTKKRNTISKTLTLHY